MKLSAASTSHKSEEGEEDEEKTGLSRKAQARKESNACLGERESMTPSQLLLLLLLLLLLQLLEKTGTPQMRRSKMGKAREEAGR